MAQIISNEIPSWPINWVNKSFTSSLSILSVSSIIMDWAEYFDFVVSWTTVTLTDAPTLSIYIDYIALWYGWDQSLSFSSLIELRVLVRTTYSKIDPNAKVWDNNTLDHYINEAYRKIQRDVWYDIPECQSSIDITTTSGTSEYARPSDLQKVMGFFQDWYELTRVTKEYFARSRASDSKPSSYYLYGGKIWFYPTPDSTYTINLIYNRTLPTITDTIWSSLPVEYNDAIASYACYLMMISVEKIAKANMTLWLYTERMNELFWQYINDDYWISFWLQRDTERARQDSI